METMSMRTAASMTMRNTSSAVKEKAVPKWTWIRLSSLSDSAWMFKKEAHHCRKRVENVRGKDGDCADPDDEDDRRVQFLGLGDPPFLPGFPYFVFGRFFRPAFILGGEPLEVHYPVR